MIPFLFAFILCAFIVIFGILVYQHKHIRIHTDEKGDIIDRMENPLSNHNIHKVSNIIHEFFKTELKNILVFTLKMLIFLKKLSRRLLDRGITKIAGIVFPEKEYTGPIDENTLLSHVEEHKKTGEKGQIHL